MTENQYESLAAVAEGDGMTLGEWVREVLLQRADGRKPSVIEETLLAEELELRTILLNVHFTVAIGETITAENMQAIIDRADAGKAKKAAERLATWDYKQKGRIYEDFGNFNCGASGHAFGFPDNMLLREVGRAYQIADPRRRNMGLGDRGSRLWGGTPPYGDDPLDQEQIKKGITYCKCQLGQKP